MIVIPAGRFSMGSPDAPQRHVLKFDMSGPNVDGIIEKAKQLCRLDGMLWSSLDFQNPMAIQTRTARMASDADRRRYLKQAQTLLETQTAPLIVRHPVFCTMPIAAPD
jgi:hypothetical protein